MRAVAVANFMVAGGFSLAKARKGRDVRSGSETESKRAGLVLPEHQGKSVRKFVKTKRESKKKKAGRKQSHDWRVMGDAKEGIKQSYR